MKEITLQQFAQNLKSEMERSDTPQSELARRSKITQQTVSDYLAGKVFPSFNRMVRMAKAMGISFFELTGQSEEDVKRELKK